MDSSPSLGVHAVLSPNEGWIFAERVRVDHSCRPQVLHIKVTLSRTAVSATSTADAEKVRTVPCSLESKQKQLVASGVTDCLFNARKGLLNGFRDCRVLRYIAPLIERVRRPTSRVTNCAVSHAVRTPLVDWFYQ